MKLSKTQQELYEAMKNGAKIHFMAGLNPWYFRTDTDKRVLPSSVRIIEKLPDIERVNEDWRGYTLIYKQNRV